MRNENAAVAVAYMVLQFLEVTVRDLLPKKKEEASTHWLSHGSDSNGQDSNALLFLYNRDCLSSLPPEPNKLSTH